MPERMNPAIKAEWVAALRSGEYPQGRHWLENKGKYCCLGVLCDLAVKKGDLQRFEDGWRITYAAEHGASEKTLPVAIYGIEGILPGFMAGDHYFSLAAVNDIGFTFDQIADLIEYFL